LFPNKPQEGNPRLSQDIFELQNLVFVSLSVKKKGVFFDRFKMPTHCGIVELLFSTQNLPF